MIELKDATKKLGSFTLGPLNVKLEKGCYSVVLGPSGAGKTLFMEIIAGLSDLDSGIIRINGRDALDLPPQRRSIGFCYQDYALFPNMDVFENISFGLRLRKHRDIKPKVGKIARVMGIQDLLKRDVKDLSGGEKQRVALARALAIDPDILLLDEPLSALDKASALQIIKELKRIHRSRPKLTIIHITHDFDEAISLAEKVLVMNNGRILQSGEPRDVFNKPKDPFVASFVGLKNIYKGCVGSHDGVPVFETGDLRFRVITDCEGDAYATIAAHDVIISIEPSETSARNHFEGIVKDMEDKGMFVELTVDIGVDLTVTITKESALRMDLHDGKRCHVLIKATAIHVFKA
ncbi:MAG: ABC transporter ATP-binding protein [Deltaproteobacteria bacterium]|nr:ABC transporter ATP-binding protein [Deltaproteobacteria bacterium]